MNCKTCDVLLRYVREEDEGACDECARDEYIADNRRLANRVGELEGWLHAADDDREAVERERDELRAEVERLRVEYPACMNEAVRLRAAIIAALDNLEGGPEAIVTADADRATLVAEVEALADWKAQALAVHAAADDKLRPLLKYVPGSLGRHVYDVAAEEITRLRAEVDRLRRFEPCADPDPFRG